MTVVAYPAVVATAVVATAEEVVSSTVLVPATMWKGNEYWKTVVSLSRVIMIP